MTREVHSSAVQYFQSAQAYHEAATQTAKSAKLRVADERVAPRSAAVMAKD